MLINELFIDKEKYNAMPIQRRMLYDIIAFEANYIFADTIIDILVKRNPNYYDDTNDLFQIRSFQADRDTAWECKYRFTRLFESEYGELSAEVKEEIKTVAREFANIPLVKFGWIKETAND